jgi:hypothetical protein
MLRLTLAAYKGDAVLTRQYIDEGDDLEAADTNGWTALIWNLSSTACSSTDCSPDTACLEILINAGANIEHFSFSGLSPLLCAVMNNCDSTRILVAAGADMERADSHGITPLEHAILYDKCDTVRIMIKSGVNVNRKGNTINYISMGEMRKLLIANAVLVGIRRLRFLKFKVIRKWTSFDSLHSPRSNSMFYGMGMSIKNPKSLKELQSDIPHTTSQNHKFYEMGCVEN